MLVSILVELPWNAIVSIDGDAFEDVTQASVVMYLHENTRAPDTMAVIMHKGNANNK